MRLLITGGAGYIGSHFVARALEHGLCELIVVDDLSTGLRRRLPEKVEFHQLDLAQEGATSELVSILREDVDAVVHFAAKETVEESVAYPEEYFHNNVGGTVNLLYAMREANVKKMIFSSSASVYGEPHRDVVYETTALRPINPYGQSKHISELALENASIAWGLEAVSLRYFNVAGTLNSPLADTTTSNLMPAIRERLTRGKTLQIFGADYDTPDGTCIRDYIHVLDLIDAHLVALDYLDSNESSGLETFNVGTGLGSSVLEIVETFQKVSSLRLDYEYVDRRRGDPSALMANVDKIANKLSWQAKYTAQDIIQSIVDHPPLDS